MVHQIQPGHAVFFRITCNDTFEEGFEKPGIIDKYQPLSVFKITAYKACVRMSYARQCSNWAKERFCEVFYKLIAMFSCSRLRIKFKMT